MSYGCHTGKDMSWQLTPGVNMQVAYSYQHMRTQYVPSNTSQEAVVADEFYNAAAEVDCMSMPAEAW